MSGLEHSTVVSRVGAIISAYHDGARLLARLRAERKAESESVSLQEHAIQELEASLRGRQLGVQDQFDRDTQRFGERFAIGDNIAREALTHVMVRIRQVIADLKSQRQQGTAADYFLFQDVCNSTQDQAVMALLQLQQRLIMKDPIANMKFSPLLWDSEAAAGQDNLHEAHQFDERPSAIAPVVSPPDEGTKDLPPLPTADVKPSPPDRKNTFGSIQDKDRESGLPSNSDERHKHKLRLSFLSNKRKDPTPATAPVEHVAKSFSDAPIVPQQWLPTSVNQGLPHPTANQISTETAISTETISDPSSRLDPLSFKDESSNTDTDQIELSPDSNNPISHTTRDNHSITSSARSCTSSEIRSGPYPKCPVLPTTVTVITAKRDSPISTEDLLPSEANKFSGFCKGAWRLQTGDAKREMDDRQRPGSTYGSIKYWQCAHCTFQGRLIQIDKKTKGYDRQIMLADGIQFSWAFLFKSHVECQGAVARNPLKCTFGCIFCCANGRGTPVFEGAQALMNHFQEHCMRLPEGEVMMRMNCVVGEKAEVEKDFDILI